MPGARENSTGARCTAGLVGLPDFVGSYRRHVPDAVVFDTEARVTVQ